MSAGQLPPPGTVLRKVDRNGAVRCEAVVGENGQVVYRGVTYSSISAAAKVAAGDIGLAARSCDGYAFFGLKNRSGESAPRAARTASVLPLPLPVRWDDLFQSALPQALPQALPDHSAHGRADANGAPLETDCACRGGALEEACAEAGCGFCCAARMAKDRAEFDEATREACGYPEHGYPTTPAPAPAPASITPDSALALANIDPRLALAAVAAAPGAQVSNERTATYLSEEAECPKCGPLPPASSMPPELFHGGGCPICGSVLQRSKPRLDSVPVIVERHEAERIDGAQLEVEPIEVEQPVWARDSASNVLWSEDDTTVSDPDHEDLAGAWERIFGTSRSAVTPLKCWDGSDAKFYIYDGGVIAVLSYPGNSDLRLLKGAPVPQGARVCAAHRHAFDRFGACWKCVVDGQFAASQHKGTDPSPSPSSAANVSAMRAELLEEIDNVIQGTPYWQGGRLDTIKYLLARVEKAEAEAAVRGVEWCAANRAAGRGPCGACAWCCKQATERADLAVAVLAEIDQRERARPKIVCLCGSTRFKDAFIETNKSETLAGRIVLSVGCFGHVDTSLTDEQKAALDELHKHKIDFADEVLVLNVGGYIGASTRIEIDYAVAHGKPVRYLEQIDQGPAPEGPPVASAGITEGERRQDADAVGTARTADFLPLRQSDPTGPALAPDQPIVKP